MKPQRDIVSEVVELLADGKPVDWQEVEACAENAHERALLHQLRVIGTIDQTYRDLAPGTQGWEHRSDQLGVSPAIPAVTTSRVAIGRSRVRHETPRRPWLVAGTVTTGVFAVILLALGIVRMRELDTRRSGDRVPVLAVLPFDGSSPDDYFAEGITDAVSQALSRTATVRVIARTSATTSKETERSLPEVAAALSADAVLRGVVRRENQRVQVTVQLTRADGDPPSWDHDFEDSVTNVLALRADVATSIARELRLHIPSDRSRDSGTERAVDPEALDAYFRGLYYVNRYTLPEIKSAVRYFEESIRRDASYTSPYAGLAQCYLMLGGTYGELTRADTARLTRMALTRALDLDDANAQAHAMLGVLRFEFDWDWFGADEAFRHALSLNPSHELARERYAMFLAARGQPEGALRQILAAEQLDPLSPFMVSSRATILYYLRRYDEALVAYQRALELDSTYVLAHVGLGRTYSAQRRVDDALTHYSLAMDGSTRDGFLQAEMALVLAAAGRTGEAAQATRLLTERSADGSWYVEPRSYAYIYAWLGDLDRAFLLLQQVFDSRSPGILWLTVDPRVDPLRADPRFHEFLSLLGL